MLAGINIALINVTLINYFCILKKNQKGFKKKSATKTAQELSPWSVALATYLQFCVGIVPELC